MYEEHKFRNYYIICIVHIMYILYCTYYKTVLKILSNDEEK